MAISAGLLGVVLLLTDLTTAANVAQLVGVVLAGASSAAALIAWGRSRPTFQPTPGPAPPQLPAPIKKPRQPGEVAGAIASVVALVALVAAYIFGPGLLSADAPNDAAGLVTAHIGDCVGSRAGADGYWVVPCWFKAAAYRVISIGLRRGPNYDMTRAIAERFCQDSPGWDPTGIHVPAFPDDYTTVTVCLVHT